MNKLLRLTTGAFATLLWAGVLLVPEARAGSATGALTVRVVVLPNCSAAGTRGDCSTPGQRSGTPSAPAGMRTGAASAPLRIIEQKKGKNAYHTVVY